VRPFAVSLSVFCLAAATYAHAGPRAASAPLLDTAGVRHGTVSIREKGNMIHGTVKATRMEPGLHGMHIHEVGRCSGDGFSDARAHWNPQGRQHGLQNPLGAHLGDLPQLRIGADGKGRVRFVISTTMADLLGGDGSALVVHAKPDDDRTDPSGNSGARLLCAALGPAGPR